MKEQIIILNVFIHSRAWKCGNGDDHRRSGTFANACALAQGGCPAQIIKVAIAMTDFALKILTRQL